MYEKLEAYYRPRHILPWRKATDTSRWRRRAPTPASASASALGLAPASVHRQPDDADAKNGQRKRNIRILAIASITAVVILAVVLVVVSQTTDAFAKPPAASRRSLCASESQLQRKEWRNLTDTEKLAYIDADLCLMNATRSPSRLPVEGLQSRWDDLQWVHLTQSNYVHGTGQFLPWHRYFVWLHEHLQRTECNYTGAQPYWEQLLDVDTDTDTDPVPNSSSNNNNNSSSPFWTSPIWDPTTGMGGNGTGPGGCIEDGPFANVTLHMDNDANVVDYCITRAFNQTAFQFANQTYLARCFATTEYDTAWACFHDNPGPHTAGHSATGGLMALSRATPGDPVFYLHHANLDRLWWEWQTRDLSARLHDMGGPNTPSVEFLNSPSREWAPPSASLVDYSGDPGEETTLRHVLWMGGVVGNVTVGEVMDVQGTAVCVDYV